MLRALGIPEQPRLQRRKLQGGLRLRLGPFGLFATVPSMT